MDSQSRRGQGRRSPVVTELPHQLPVPLEPGGRCHVHPALRPWPCHHHPMGVPAPPAPRGLTLRTQAARREPRGRRNAFFPRPDGAFQSNGNHEPPPAGPGSISASFPRPVGRTPAPPRLPSPTASLPRRTPTPPAVGCASPPAHGLGAGRKSVIANNFLRVGWPGFPGASLAAGTALAALLPPAPPSPPSLAPPL